MSLKDAIVYIDPFSHHIIKADKSGFESVQKIKRHFVGSRVGFEDVITYSFKTHKSISKEDLEIEAELKMYEEAGLQTDKKYKIDYIKKEIDYEESYIIEAYALDIEKSKERLAFVLDKSKHIDFLALPHLSFEALYSSKILSAKKDIFIYFGEDEAFLSIYKEGRYLSSSSLYTLNEMAHKLNNTIPEIADTQTLRDILKEKGLDAKRYTQEQMPIYQAIYTLFSEILNKINNIAMHNRSIFGFDTIERIFLSTVDGRIKGFREFVKDVGFESVWVGDFDLFKQKSKEDFLDKIVASYIYYKKITNDNTNNITFLEKGKAFYKTKAGKLVLFMLGSVAIASAYPLYLALQNSALEKEKEMLTQRYETLKKQTRGIKKQIVKSKLDIKKIDKAISMQKSKLSNLEKSIDELIALTSKDKKSSKTILLIDRYLKKYHLTLKSMRLEQNHHITLDIIARYNRRDDIARFMKDLVKVGFVKVATKEIKLDKRYYISKVEIEK